MTKESAPEIGVESEKGYEGIVDEIEIESGIVAGIEADVDDAQKGRDNYRCHRCQPFLATWPRLRRSCSCLSRWFRLHLSHLRRLPGHRQRWEDGADRAIAFWS